MLDLEAMLAELTDRYDVPGASLAVLQDGEVTTAAVGSLNRDTGVDATTDSLFQIGSITKLFTTAAVMRLVERDELDLDEPVVKHLPEFTTADPDAARAVTLRHLLTHTSGIDGDHFLDTGRGDDVLEKYVASCAELPQQFPVGATHSYCNAGFSVAGRVLEVVTGQVWDDVLREEVLDAARPRPHHDAARGRAAPPRRVRPRRRARLAAPDPAVGHARARPARPVIVLRHRRRRRDVRPHRARRRRLALARVRGDDARAAGGGAEPAHDGVALGSRLDPLRRRRRPAGGGHDGSTIGQAAALRVMPDRGVAVALLLNGGGMVDVTDALLREVLRETADIELAPSLAPVDGADGGDRALQVGVYRRSAETLEVEPDGDRGLRLTVTDTSHLAHLLDEDPEVVDLLPVSEHTYVGRRAGTEAWSAFVFFDLDGARFLHAGARAFGRVGGWAGPVSGE